MSNRDIPGWRRYPHPEWTRHQWIDYERPAAGGRYYIARVRDDGESVGEYCFLSLARGGDCVGIDPQGREVPLRAWESFYRDLSAAAAAAERHDQTGERRTRALVARLVGRYAGT